MAVRELRAVEAMVGRARQVYIRPRAPRNKATPKHDLKTQHRVEKSDVFFRDAPEWGPGLDKAFNLGASAKGLSESLQLPLKEAFKPSVNKPLPATPMLSNRRAQAFQNKKLPPLPMEPPANTSRLRVDKLFSNLRRK